MTRDQQTPSRVPSCHVPYSLPSLEFTYFFSSTHSFWILSTHVFAMPIFSNYYINVPSSKAHSIHSFIASCRNPKVHHDESKFVVASPTSLCRWTDHLHRCQVLKRVHTMPRAHAGLEVLKSAGRSTEITPVGVFFFLTPCTQWLPSQCIQDSVNAYLQSTCTRLHYFHRRLVILLPTTSANLCSPT